jgi:pimeloyl-ACP methyl ester carboxylesterase
MPYANNNEIKIHYEIEGQGPPLLLQHGFSGTLDAWRTNGYVQSLSKDYKCIFLSIRGRGKSDKPHEPSAYSYKNHVSDIVAVLDDAGVKKAHYIGYSMGGAIGFRIPLYAPGRFQSLILGGAGYNPGKPIQDYGDFLGSAYAAMEKAVAEGKTNPMEAFFALYEKSAGTVPPERKAEILAQDGVALAAACKASREDIGPAPSAYLPEFKLPCFIPV